MKEPMLAATAKKIEDIVFPVLASHKLDGIRAVVVGGQLLTRSLKPVPNKLIQQEFGRAELNGLDGELICGEPGAKDVFQRTTSAVMSIEATEPVKFHVFDRFDLDDVGFKRRQHEAAKLAQRVNRELFRKSEYGLVHVIQTNIFDKARLLEYEQRVLLEGYEGVMLRDPSGLYKFGRSTLKERGLLKLKRFTDSEAEIVNFKEQLTNNNESVVNARGYKEKSSKKENKASAGVLGAFVVMDLKTGIQFDVGSGMTAAQRDLFWATKEQLKGKIIKYRYQPVGVKDKPRFPVFLGFRDKKDM